MTEPVTHSHEEQAKRHVSWAEARNATLHCLTGCAIGEVLGMVIGSGFGLSNATTILISIVLAFAFGYSLTMRSVLRTGVTLTVALTVALAADTVSIGVMELVDNSVVLAIPGAINAQLADPIFWVSLIISLIIAFLAAWPVNRYLISRGLGHAKAHQFHSH